MLKILMMNVMKKVVVKVVAKVVVNVLVLKVLNPFLMFYVPNGSDDVQQF